MCIQADAFDAGLRMVAYLVVVHLGGTTSSNTEKVPPKPQHSSGRPGRTNSIPSTLESRSMGLEKRLARLGRKRVLEPAQCAANVVQICAIAPKLLRTWWTQLADGETT
jgi:hypothetical protein